MEIWVVVKKVGDRIRKIRVSKDYSQENMADELKITTSAYSKIERGMTDANASRLIQIAKVLDVNVADFFSDPSAFKEDTGKYGYATREEVENLGRLVSILAKEIEKLREELQGKNVGEKKRKKK